MERIQPDESERNLIPIQIDYSSPILKYEEYDSQCS